MAKALLIKKNDKVVLKDVFFGNADLGITNRKAKIEGLNPSVTFTYAEYADSEDTNFVNATIDTTEQSTIVLPNAMS